MRSTPPDGALKLVRVVSMRAEVESVSVSAPADRLDLVRKAEDDLKAAARAGEVLYSDGDFGVETILSAD